MIERTKRVDCIFDVKTFRRISFKHKQSTNNIPNSCYVTAASLRLQFIYAINYAVTPQIIFY